jgi:hypothetical protein
MCRCVSVCVGVCRCVSCVLCVVAEDGTDVSLADRDGELLVFQAVYKAGLGPKFYGRPPLLRLSTALASVDATLTCSSPDPQASTRTAVSTGTLTVCS